MLFCIALTNPIHQSGSIGSQTGLRSSIEAAEGEATPENFPNQTSYRNPVLAEALKTLGFVERFGRGVIIARAALEQSGNPPPEFAFDSRFVRVTIRTKA